MTQKEPIDSDEYVRPGVCVHCHLPCVRLYSVSDAGTITHNYILACVNRECFLFVHQEKLTTWRKK